MMASLIPRNNKTRDLLDRLRKIEGKARNRRKFFSDFENKEFMSWTAVSKDNIKFDNEVVPGSGALTELIDWCNDNCDGNYVAHRGSLYFNNDNDAALFVMVWK